MSIVLITIPGDAKRQFANTLYQKTDGNLDLVIIQKPRKKSLMERLVRHYRHTGLGIIKEIWYALLLRLNSRLRNTLEYFRENTLSDSPAESHKTKVIEVESVNSDDVYNMLQELAPDILVVWGSSILKPHILKTAKKSVNLHFGLCPHYRGAVANQHAVLSDDFSRIGATIHLINGTADAGDILAILYADTNKPTRELFRDLNDRALAEYVEIIAQLHTGKELIAEKQGVSDNSVLLLKDWTPSLRYKLGKKVLEWEKSNSLNK